MRSEALRKAQERYEAENTVRVTVKLNRNTDADLIALLAKAESKQGLIKAALRAWGKNGD